MNSSHKTEIRKTSEKHKFRQENYTNWNQVLHQQTHQAFILTAERKKIRSETIKNLSVINVIKEIKSSDVIVSDGIGVFPLRKGGHVTLDLRPRE